MSKSSENTNENNISKEELKEFTAIIKRYVNLPKILMFIDKSIASEFIKKQDYFFKLRNKENPNISHSCCGDDNNPINNESKYMIKD